MWALWRPRRHSPGSGQAHHGVRPPGHLRLPGRSTAIRGCARADAGQWSVPSEAWRSSGVAEAIGSPVRGPCWAQAVEVAEGLHIWCPTRRHDLDRCTVATPLVVCTRVWRAREDSNLRLSAPQADALSTELRAPDGLAEREGFEPSEEETPFSGLANRRTRPLCDLSERPDDSMGPLPRRTRSSGHRPSSFTRI